MHRRYTQLAVLLSAVLIIGACALWALLAQHAVPTACSITPPPPRAQILHCP